MKSCFFLSASLLVACSVKAQVIFQKTYGGHQYENSDCMYRGPGSITRTAEGGYAICHATASYGVPASTSGESLYFLKIDDNGDTLVTRAYNSGGNSIGRSIFEAAGGGYVMGATMGGAAGTSLIRVNANGDTLWTRSFSPIPGGFGGTGYYGFPFNDGGFGAVGEYGETVQNHSTFCAGLAKVDANGNLVFGKTYYYNPALFNGTGMRFYSASPTSDGGVLATGYIDDMEIDVVVVRMDSTGNVLWAKSYDLSTEEAGLMAKELPDHSIAVTGYVALSTT
ncbi:MAG TPA: hypothetical protein VFU15_13045, partial [Bacteroidia bacterium]|nr:hypothetical protein [Bacteroidia bacterium]